MPQGPLAERTRAAGAAIGGLYTPPACGSFPAKDRETRRTGSPGCFLEFRTRAACARTKAERADRWGNLAYRKTARNFAPIMASAARCTVAQVQSVVPLGELDPEAIVTPGIFVQRVVQAAA